MKVQVAFFLDLFRREDNLVFDSLMADQEGDEVVADPLFRDFNDLAKMLRNSSSTEIPNIYSPNNSLIAVPVYGRNIDDYRKQLETLLENLMMDKLIDHDTFMESRQEVFLRAHFFIDGRFADHEKAILQFRETAIRMVEGYELRRRNLELGINTFQNLVTTQGVLRDIQGFFNEIYNGNNRNSHVSGAGTDQHRA